MLFSSLAKKNFSKDFKGKTFILTGYSSGIGQQVFHDLKKWEVKLFQLEEKKLRAKKLLIVILKT